MPKPTPLIQVSKYIFPLLFLFTIITLLPSTISLVTDY